MNTSNKRAALSGYRAIPNTAALSFRITLRDPPNFISQTAAPVPNGAKVVGDLLSNEQ